jgi:hypothetical protein
MERTDLIRLAIEGNAKEHFLLGILYCIKEDKTNALYWLEKVKNHEVYNTKEIIQEIQKLNSTEH